MAAANACDGGRDHRPLLEYGGVDDLSHPSASLCATQTKRTQAQERLSTYPRRGTSMTPAFCETTMSANGQTVFEKLVTWRDQNWFFVRSVPHPGRPYLVVEFAPARDEWGVSL